MDIARHYAKRLTGATKKPLPPMYMDGRDPSPEPTTSIADDFADSMMQALSTHFLPSNGYEQVGVASLPPEILSLIFEVAKPLHKHRSVHVLPIEVIVSQVSSFWRGVALATPVLWSQIDYYSKHSLSRVNQYLQRAGAIQLLDVNIDIYRADRETKHGRRPLIGRTRIPALIQLISTAIEPYLARVRTLSINCCHDQSALVLQSFFAQSAVPNLRGYRVKFGSISSQPHAREVWRNAPLFGGGAQKLVFLESDTPNVLPPALTSNVWSLTTLHFNSPGYMYLQMNYGSFVKMLLSLPALTHLSIEKSINFDTWPYHTANSHFTLPNLQSLRLLEDGMMAVKMLLSMAAPKLETLSLNCSFDNFHRLFDAPQMNMGLTATGSSNGSRTKFPNLQYLTTHGDDFTNVHRFAQAFPTVTHLHFEYGHFTRVDKLLPVLIGRWASVHTVVFTMFRERHAKKVNETLLEVLKTRKKGTGVPMRSLLLDVDHLSYMRETAPRIMGLIKVQPLSLLNYGEYWWVMNEKRVREGYLLA